MIIIIITTMVTGTIFVSAALEINVCARNNTIHSVQ